MNTKICKCCGRELPLEAFRKTRLGVMNTCYECVSKNIAKAKADKKEEAKKADEVRMAKAARLSDFEPVELMRELKRRGYEGKLTYTKTFEIDITNIDDKPSVGRVYA